jgi:hypothetical protein
MTDSPMATPPPPAPFSMPAYLPLPSPAVSAIVRKMLGWPTRRKLVHAFLWEHSYKRLKLAQLLGQLGFFLTHTLRFEVFCNIIFSGKYRQFPVNLPGNTAVCLACQTVTRAHAPRQVPLWQRPRVVGGRPHRRRVLLEHRLRARRGVLQARAKRITPGLVPPVGTAPHLHKPMPLRLLH